MFGKPIPTASDKNALNREIDRFNKALETTKTADTVKAYGDAMRQLAISADKLKNMENAFNWRRGNYKWKGGFMAQLPRINEQITNGQKKFVDRAFLRLKWDCAALQTEAAKQRRKKKLFEEFEAYSIFFDPETLEYVESFREDSGIHVSVDVE